VRREWDRGLCEEIPKWFKECGPVPCGLSLLKRFPVRSCPRGEDRADRDCENRWREIAKAAKPPEMKKQSSYCTPLHCLEPHLDPRYASSRTSRKGTTVCRCAPADTEEGAEAPTAMLGRRQRKSRLPAPFYGVSRSIYSLALWTTTGCRVVTQ
jgi:hypothetical protein